MTLKLVDLPGPATRRSFDLPCSSSCRLMRLQHIEMISKELPLQGGKLDKYGSIWGTNLQHQRLRAGRIMVFNKAPSPVNK